MVEIVDGLKSKLVEIDSQIELLRRQIATLEDQRIAFVKVIRVYDPEFTVVNASPRKPRSAQRGTACSRVTELLKGKNNRHVVLDILRRSDRPTSSAEIARQFATDVDLGEEEERLETALASRFSRQRSMDYRSRVSSNMLEPSMAVATYGRSAVNPEARPGARLGR